jgi:curved DNA-binding protein CbpA
VKVYSDSNLPKVNFDMSIYQAQARDCAQRTEQRKLAKLLRDPHCPNIAAQFLTTSLKRDKEDEVAQPVFLPNSVRFPTTLPRAKGKAKAAPRSSPSHALDSKHEDLGVGSSGGGGGNEPGPSGTARDDEHNDAAPTPDRPADNSGSGAGGGSGGGGRGGRGGRGSGRGDRGGRGRRSPVPDPFNVRCGSDSDEDKLLRFTNEFLSAITRMGNRNGNSSCTKIREPKTYGGKDPSKLQDFLLLCELNFADRLQAFRTDEKKVTYGLSFLRAPALLWFKPALMYRSTTGYTPD